MFNIIEDRLWKVIIAQFYSAIHNQTTLQKPILKVFYRFTSRQSKIDINNQEIDFFMRCRARLSKMYVCYKTVVR